eukprot:TRINITY_DN4576_c0_g1_i2.p1 TRINITY_DN4576_c0_g1~~TRINITY_DN4576_c0_g1_i2.p1  ORF type:complete len:934 (-),score=337.66 TRINITY_DN4576_c0_g1_i2:334-3135(-)
MIEAEAIIAAEERPVETISRPPSPPLSAFASEANSPSTSPRSSSFILSSPNFASPISPSSLSNSSSFSTPTTPIRHGRALPALDLSAALNPLKEIELQVEFDNYKMTMTQKVQDLSEDLASLTAESQENAKALASLQEKYATEQAAHQKLQADFDFKVTHDANETAKNEYRMKEAKLQAENAESLALQQKNRREELEVELAKLKEVLSGKSLEYDRMNREQTKHSLEVQLVKQKMNTWEKKSKELESRLVSITSERDALRSSFEKLEDDHLNQGFRAKAVEEELHSILQQNIDITARLDLRTQEKGALARELEEAKAAVSHLETSLVLAKEEREKAIDVEVELAATKEELYQLVQTNQELHLSVKNAQISNAKMQEDLGALQSQLDSQRSETQSAEQKLTAKKEMLQKADEQLNALSKQILELNSAHAQQLNVLNEQLKNNEFQLGLEVSQKEQVEGQLQEVRTLLLEKERLLTKAVEDKARLQKERNELARRSQALNEDTAKTLSENEQLAIEMAANAKKVALLEEKLATSESAFQATKLEHERNLREYVRIEKELAYYKQKVEQAQKDTQDREAKLTTEMQDLQKKHQDLQYFVLESEEHTRELESKVETLNTKDQQSLARINELVSEKLNLEMSVEELKSKLLNADNTGQVLAKEKGNKERELNSAKVLLELTKKSNQDLQAHFDQSKLDLGRLTEESILQRAEIEQIRMDKQQLESKMQELERSNESAASQLKKELQDQKSRQESVLAELRESLGKVQEELEDERNHKALISQELETTQKGSLSVERDYQTLMEENAKLKRDFSELASLQKIQTQYLDQKNERIKQQEKEIEDLTVMSAAFKQQMEVSVRAYTETERMYKEQLRYHEEASTLAVQRQQQATRIVQPIQPQNRSRIWDFFSPRSQAMPKRSAIAEPEKTGYLTKQGGVIK